MVKQNMSNIKDEQYFAEILNIILKNSAERKNGVDASTKNPKKYSEKAEKIFAKAEKMIDDFKQDFKNFTPANQKLALDILYNNKENVEYSIFDEKKRKRMTKIFTNKMKAIETAKKQKLKHRIAVIELMPENNSMYNDKDNFDIKKTAFTKMYTIPSFWQRKKSGKEKKLFP